MSTGDSKKGHTVVINSNKVYRPCHVLLVNDVLCSNRHLTTLLETVFEGCTLLCSFDICTEADVNKQLQGDIHYDIMFLTKGIISTDWFSSFYTQDDNTVIPLIIYKYSFTFHFMLSQKRKRPQHRSKYIVSLFSIGLLSYIRSKEAKTYTFGNIIVSDEISYPHSLFEICASIIRFVYIPFYHNNFADIHVLEHNCRNRAGV